ncbi:complement C1q-like protein 4 [Mya arenaria]|uniref:complement C1q-like protein 4 n=1 Tax=Mya arenaria TaxID=6604 RepID=UPI0022E8CADE|nr:complement C1q-like protein 4 [Mya arenaria]
MFASVTFCLIVVLLFSAAEAENEILNRITNLEKECKAEISKLNSNVRDLQSEVEELKAENKWGKEQLQDLMAATFTTEGKLRPRRQGQDDLVAFFATIRTAQPYLGQGQTIVFDNVITNLGGGYHQTGLFTAPYDGVYVFSVTLVTAFDQSSHASFFKNSEQITVMYFHGNAIHDYDTSTQTIVLDLYRGDIVSIRQTESAKSYHSNDHCLYSGFLLKQKLSTGTVG